MVFSPRMQDLGLSKNTNYQSVEAPAGNTPPPHPKWHFVGSLSGGATVGPPGSLTLL